jgi:hypothetical protein
VAIRSTKTGKSVPRRVIRYEMGLSPLAVAKNEHVAAVAWLTHLKEREARSEVARRLSKETGQYDRAVAREAAAVDVLKALGTCSGAHERRQRITVVLQDM